MHNNWFVKNIYRKKAVSPESPKFIVYKEEYIVQQESALYKEIKMKDRNRRIFVHIFELDRNVRMNNSNIHLIRLEKPRLHWFPIFVVILQMIQNINQFYIADSM